MFERRLKGLKDALTDASQPVVDRTMETAAVADGYVRGHPWTAIAIGVAVGALIGFAAARR